MAAPLQAEPDEAGAWAQFSARQQQLEALGVTSKALPERVFYSGLESDCAVDSDGDGLPDCVESNTGRFVDLVDTGTDPGNPDSDGDGLGDGDEVLGTSNGLDLAALGVNPNHRDLLVEYDWVDDAISCAAHSHRPGLELMARMAQVMSAWPLENRDGLPGIHLVQDAGQGGELIGGTALNESFAVLPGALDASYYDIKQAYFASNRNGAFHYLLLVHQYGGGSSSSGYAEVVGDDAIVSLACATVVDDYLLRTLLHELGHNLGLQHGGFERCNGKPNYNSLLNYRFQFSGIDDDCDGVGDQLTNDYSDGRRVRLDERALDESAGICDGLPIDWNVDGTIDASISFDLHEAEAASCGATLRSLEDFDDIRHLSLLGIRGAAALKQIQLETGCPGALPPALPH